MRIFPRVVLPAAALVLMPIMPSALIQASAVAQKPPPGVEVDRVTLMPGDSRAFTLAPGNTHQLLVPARPGAKGVITVHYDASAAGSTLTVSSTVGRSLSFTILADQDGSGAFKPAGDALNLPGDGRAVVTRWPTNIGAVNVGDFTG